MRRLVLACCIAVVGSPGFSQPKKADSTFYVQLNTLTKQCAIVDKPPKTDTPNITIASDAVYETRAEAESAMKTLKPCMH